MSSSIQHLSHPNHPLVLKEDDVIGEDATCYVCNKTVIGSPTYTCTSRDDIVCQNYYLHKTCAELPAQIDHDEHDKHSLTLQPRPMCVCDVCDNEIKFAYACVDCNFDVCVDCAFACPSDEQRVFICHEGHPEHTLTLLHREASFLCDACREESRDFSYVCVKCNFWIHKRCAFLPFIIPAPTYHHHPLNLVFSIPVMHCNFLRYCGICDEVVHVRYWLYYCHKCTYFVHIKCATSTVSTLNETETADCSVNEPDLKEFPLHSEEALFDLLTSQCAKFQVDFKGERKDTVTILTPPNDLRIIEEHWSHPKHPLELLHLIVSENHDDDNDDNTSGLICDGCIQPITATRPSYYACIQCGFFLHSLCACELPRELPIGAFPFHPQHSLSLLKKTRFYDTVTCGVCSYSTNGFYYECETWDITIDIHCAFLPARIKHKSHKYHPLVQRPSSVSKCSVSKGMINVGMEYACEICSNFHIGMNCVVCPSKVKHRYDIHPIALRYPPFFYEGVFYCEICEEAVNNQWWLFHCDESDHSFHCKCLYWLDRIKLGGTVVLDINNQKHTLAFVRKMNTRPNSPLYLCANCRNGYSSGLFFECDGCGFLICVNCESKIHSE